MAKLNYEHVHASAGFSGEIFDVNLGYNVTWTNPTAGDGVFTAVDKKLTFTADTIPTWLREIGKYVEITGTASNPGPFRVAAYDTVTFKWVQFQETVVNETPAGAITINGSKEPKLISDLLKNVTSPTAAALTEDAPLVLKSSGALGGPRILDFSGMEVETVARGGYPLRGRPVMLLVQNTDISATNKLTIKASGLMNGLASIDIVNTGDYLVTHLENGDWEVNLLPKTGDTPANLKRIPFTAMKWHEGAAQNTIVCTATAAPGLGEVGPHNLALYTTYLVQVWDDTNATWTEEADVEIQVDKATSNIRIQKAAKKLPFAGYIVIGGTLD